MDERNQLLECANQSAPAIQRLADCENKYLLLYDKECKYHKRAGWVWLGIILFSLMTFASLSGLFAGKQIIGNLVGIVICGGLAALCFLPFMKHSKRKKVLIPEANAEIDRAQADPALSWLPPKYRITTYIYKIIEYLSNMRAKTLQEALNLLETEIHQATLENLAAIGAINGNTY